MDEKEIIEIYKKVENEITNKIQLSENVFSCKMDILGLINKIVDLEIEINKLKQEN